MTDQEREFQWWQTGLYCDRSTPEGKERVESVMYRVIDTIIIEEESQKSLGSALFEVYVSFGDNPTAMRILCDLIEAQLFAVFEREQQKTADHS